MLCYLSKNNNFCFIKCTKEKSQRVFESINSVRSNSFEYESLTGCKVIGVSKLEFVEKTQFHCLYVMYVLSIKLISLIPCICLETIHTKRGAILLLVIVKVWPMAYSVKRKQRTALYKRFLNSSLWIFQPNICFVSLTTLMETLNY